MNTERYRGRSTVASWRDEIEHAIDNVKRSSLDKWMRKEWHMAGARDRGTEGRKARWVGRGGGGYGAD